MKRSPYFASRPRACLTETHAIEMALLKLCMRNCLNNGGGLAYDGRVHVYNLGDRLQIARPTEPQHPIEIDPNRVEDAVNLFVDTVAAEVTFSLDSFVFIPASNTGGVPWRHLRRNHTISALCGSSPFGDLLPSSTTTSPLNLDEFHHEPDPSN